VSIETPVDLNSHLGVALRFAYQQALANLGDEIRPLGLTPIQVSVLARLHERGAITQGRLGRSLDMEPPNVRDVVHRLARRGLVALSADPADRRAVLVDLTGAGRDLFAEVWPRAEAANARTLQRLTADEHRTLVDLLRRLARQPADRQQY
jgi:DNA-binding MarR family transcriptional regulator